jgi:hypothetical protein
MAQKTRSVPRRFVYYSSLFFIPVVAFLVIGEIVVRVFSPVPSMYPRYKYSPEYGFALYENTRMVHVWPRKFKFYYTINQYGYRGPSVDPSGAHDKASIVVLGDSFSFGMGVNDGEEYASVLRDALHGSCDVINLATPGWGLTQEIRRYYEFGRFFRPQIVVLQYCSNDPEDNLNNRVTRIQAGEFTFHNSTAVMNWPKRFLSRSLVQKSQLYNFFRGRAYEFFQNRYVNRKSAELAEEILPSESSVPGGERSSPGEAMPREILYCELLTTFCSKIQVDGTRLIVIAGRRQLDEFPNISECVLTLEAEGALDYLDIEPWLKGVANRHSPEGHWGAGAHRAIGEHLAEHVQSLSANQWR